jgi:hypothetical protein
MHRDRSNTIHAPWWSAMAQGQVLSLLVRRHHVDADTAPMRVLSGRIFAMFGLYDYWIDTKDERAQTLFDGAATTILRFVPELRAEGKPSCYGMRLQDDPLARPEKYHRIHVQQLTKMTGDMEFARLSNLLREDFY